MEETKAEIREWKRKIRKFYKDKVAEYLAMGYNKVGARHQTLFIINKEFGLHALWLIRPPRQAKVVFDL